MTTKKQAMLLSSQGRDTNEEFLKTDDSVVTQEKLQNALISLGVYAGRSETDVGLVSNDNPYESRTARIAQCKADCVTLKRMKLRQKYPLEAVAHRNILQRSKPHVRALSDHRDSRMRVGFPSCYQRSHSAGVAIGWETQTSLFYWISARRS